MRSRVAFVLLLSACASAPPDPAVRAPAAAPAPGDVRALLVRRCGECHQSSRPTAVPEALQVFDLDRSDWPARFDARRFEVALQRLGNDPARDRELFIAFHRAAPQQR